MSSILSLSPLDLPRRTVPDGRGADETNIFICLPFLPPGSDRAKNVAFVLYGSVPSTFGVCSLLLLSLCNAGRPRKPHPPHHSFLGRSRTRPFQVPTMRRRKGQAKQLSARGAGRKRGHSLILFCYPGPSRNTFQDPLPSPDHSPPPPLSSAEKGER